MALGARRLVRIGTCGALVAGLDLGAVVAVERALPNDGASAALGANGSVSGSHALLERLVATGARAATVVSTDLFYDRRGGEAAGWVEQGAVAVEMETAAIFQVASRREAEAACVLGVTADPDEHRATPEQVESIGLRSWRRGLRGAQDSVTVRRSWARGTGSSLGATAARRRARSPAISPRRSSIAPSRSPGRAGREGAQALFELVERVLDSLEALGHRAQAPGHALDVGGGRQVQCAERRLLRLDRLLAGLEGSCDRPVDHRVGDQLLGDLAECFLALPRQLLDEALVIVRSGHCIPA